MDASVSQDNLQHVDWEFHPQVSVVAHWDIYCERLFVLQSILLHQKPENIQATYDHQESHFLLRNGNNTAYRQFNKCKGHVHKGNRRHVSVPDIAYRKISD